MVQLKSEHHAVAAPPGFSVTAAGAPKAAWWEPLAKFYDEAQKQGYGNGGTQMLLHSQLSQALELLKQDPAWNSSGAAELLQKTLKKAVPNEMLRVVKELLDFVALGQSRLRQRDLRTQSYSDQGSPTSSQQGASPTTSPTASTASTSTTSGKSHDGFAVPPPRAPSNLVPWTVSMRLDGSRHKKGVSTSLCKATIQAPPLLGLPTRLMFDSLVKRRGVTLGQYKACRTSIAQATPSQTSRLHTLAKQELVATATVGKHAVLLVPYFDSRGEVKAVTFIAEL